MYIAVEILVWGNVLEKTHDAMNERYIQSEKYIQWDLLLHKKQLAEWRHMEVFLIGRSY